MDCLLGRQLLGFLPLTLGYNFPFRVKRIPGLGGLCLLLFGLRAGFLLLFRLRRFLGLLLLLLGCSTRRALVGRSVLFILPQEVEEVIKLLVELFVLLGELSDLLVLAALVVVGRALVVPTFLPSHLRAKVAALVDGEEDRVQVIGDGVLSFAYELWSPIFVGSVLR